MTANKKIINFRIVFYFIIPYNNIVAGMVTEVETMMNDGSRLVRVDKNGTEYWENYVCGLCGGSGYLVCFKHVDNGVCYECNGSGILNTPRRWQVRTPEYQAKLDAQRKAREEKVERERIQWEKDHPDEAIEKKYQQDKDQADMKWTYIFQCRTRKHHQSCLSCEHVTYCTMLQEFKEMVKAKDMAKYPLDEEQVELVNANMEQIEANRSPIETLDGQPCKVSKWYTNYFNGHQCSSRKITKPDGTSFYSSAVTNRGLLKHGCRLREVK